VVVDATAIGLWLVGVGSLAAVGSTFLDAPSRGVGGFGISSPESARPERLRHAVQSVALAFVAGGSAIVAVAELPSFWIAIAITIVFLVGVWLISAWSQHRVWLAQHEQAQRAMQAEDAAKYPLMQWKADCAAHCVRWRWALMHPFNGETWPGDFTRQHPRPSD
jgi:heme exporter protein D